MGVVILQAMYGGYDEMPDWPVQDVACRRMIITDGTISSLDLNGGPTTGVRAEPRPHMHPRLAAKIPKCMPWRYAGPDDTVIWCDASVKPIDGGFVRWMLEHAGDLPLSAFAHPLRTRIDDEAVASAWMEKYRDHDVHGQVKSYYDTGFADVGLWASGLMVWNRIDAPAIQRFGRRWFEEQCAWTYQDQLSLTYCAWRAGIGLNTLPGSLFVPEPMHFLLRPHTRDD